MTMTALRRRRLAAAVTAVAAFSALSACGSAAAVGAASSASATPGPGTLDGFCSTVMAIDAAGAESGGGGGPTTEATGTTTPAPDSVDAGSVDSDSFVYGSDLTGADATGGDAGADATTTDATGADTTPESGTGSPTAAPTSAPVPAVAPSPQELADARAVYTPLIAELERTRQPEVGDAVDTMLRLARQALETGNLDIFHSPEFTAADGTVGAFLPGKCG